MDSTLTFSTGGDSSWSGSKYSPYYYDGDAAHSGSIDDDQESWMQTTYTASAGDKVSFFWKVSSESGDYLKFYIDDQLQTSIDGEKDWEKKLYALSAGSRTLKWVYEKDSDDYEGDDCGWVDGLYVGPSAGSLPPEAPGAYSESVDSSLKFTSSGDATWSNVAGSTWDYYIDADAAMSGSTSSGQESVLQTIVESSSSQTLKFYWKVSCQANYDYLEFYIDGVLQSGRITGNVDWTLKTYTISSGIHTLKWRYNDGGGSSGENRGWVDFVQWTGYSPVPDSENWQQLDYKYDVAGRRSEKIIDGYATKYLYDGDHVIAEYDGNSNLLRKYIYGPGIDQPVSMIEVADSNATYYYHYDALGSVIALSDSSGDTVQTYEYSVFGEVYVEDANHTNPYMFAGRRYDAEIGLYYNRARYYNPFTGRFLQTDPIGYEDGMNSYQYSANNPLNVTDPLGLYKVSGSGRIEWSFQSPGGIYWDWVAKFYGKNWGEVSLSCEVDEATSTFEGAPKLIIRQGMRTLWSGEYKVTYGPTRFTEGLKTGYKVTVAFFWWQGLPKPGWVPGWVPWPRYYMRSTMTITIYDNNDVVVEIDKNTSNVSSTFTPKLIKGVEVEDESHP